MQSNYDKMKSEVPKYKMITPSILADRLRVSFHVMVAAAIGMLSFVR